jgi:hypothetical protein
VTLPSIALAALALVAGGESVDASRWTVYIANDDCPDYTWGFSEEVTRKAFADIVRGHLDEMARTDGEPHESRDRYDMAVTQEALCFVERHPDRKDELVRRIREGRIFVSPFLCNSLWGFASAEGFVRTLYPARRLEREWGIRIEAAEHIEQPSIPWGASALLPACGIQWLSVAFLDYDSTFGGLRVPPAFVLEGPDGSRLRVLIDAWASRKSNYTQGAAVLRDPKALAGEWIPHYAALGASYPLEAFFASGTHGDINPGSGGQARGFAKAIADWNAGPPPRPRLVNATLPMFCEVLDRTEEARPFLEMFRGTFGDSWDLWPVSLARHAAAMRDGERRFLAAEALAALAGARDPEIVRSMRAARERAEWCLAMLSDHAWNGTDDANRRHNADLRKRWGEDLARIAGEVAAGAWRSIGLEEDPRSVAVFNPLSFPRRGLTEIDLGSGEKPPGRIDCQFLEEDGRRFIAFVPPEVPAFGLAGFSIERRGTDAAIAAHDDKLRAFADGLEGPFYSLRIDRKTGGIASLVHRPTGRELVVPGSRRRSLGQTVWSDGAERPIGNFRVAGVAGGHVLGRLRVAGEAEGMSVASSFTLYAELDRLDIDVRIRKAPRTVEERVCQVFPVLAEGAVLRIESTGAVVRPRPAPEGDLLPGADARRFAVQGFIDASPPGGPGVTVAPLDSFALRLDVDPLVFEALGNDQNHKEVSKDQGGETEFRFRYALRAHAGPFDAAEAVAWSRSVASPLVAMRGRLAPKAANLPAVSVDPRRAVALCLKPADGPEGGLILRVWETAGLPGPVPVAARGFSRAFRTDLLERNLGELPISGGTVELPVKPRGFAAFRLVPDTARKS